MKCVMGASHGRTSRTPTRRTSRLPSGRRRASGEEVCISAGSAPPRFAPSTSARVSVAPITCVLANDPTTSTMTTLEWHPQVRSAASTTASNGSAASDCTNDRSSGVFSTGASVCCSSARDISISPSPMTARPMLRTRLPLDQRKVSTPHSTSGGAIAATLKESTCATSAVPTLAPSMTASAGASAITPAAVNEVAIRPTAVLLWSSVVMPSPVKNARQRSPRLRSSARRKLLPNPRCTPVLTMWVPHSSRPM